MLHRSVRIAGVELPEVGSKDVPLIGFRPLSPETDRRLEKNANDRELTPSQDEASSMKTTWYCPLNLSTVSEKEEDGIIYTVVVKSPTGDQSAQQSIGHRSQCVKAGTEEKLVLHLLHSFSMEDSSFISIFLSTYRSFTTTQRVLDILMDRLTNPPGDSNSPIRQAFNKAVCTVFGTWLKEYPEDFHSLGEPMRLMRLAPLIPEPMGGEIRIQLLKIAEKISDKSLIPDSPPDPSSSFIQPPPDPLKFNASGFMDFPPSIIAEQLTKIETELFLKVVPYHCLGSMWSQRDKKGKQGVCWSVRATVRQFNRLANAVSTSCLWQTQMMPNQRSKLLERWISISEACRVRKNFSSLYAIVSALQSNPIHRLRKTWQETDKEAVKRYEDLANIFSEKDNYSQSRELLKEEGTSKSVNTETKINNRRHVSNSQGTVPYLGIFLTDLTMLDAAVKDRLENGYINFDKRRREFEVLAKIRLLQSSCRNSTFRTDESFLHWYHSVPTLTEEEGYRLSNQIEPQGEPSPGRLLHPTVVITEYTDTLTGGSDYNPGMDPDVFDVPSPVNHLLSRLTKHMKSPSVSCLDVESSPPPNDSTPLALSTPNNVIKSHRRSVSCGSAPPNHMPGAGPEMRIVKIRMDLRDGNLYRSIMVSSNDKSPIVISSALEKHNQDPREASKYELIQLLPEGKELTIPATGNVFYAMSSTSVDFLLRRRGGNTPVGSPLLNNESSATFPRIKAKGRRLVRTLF